MSSETAGRRGEGQEPMTIRVARRPAADAVPTNASPLRIRPARADDAAGLAQVYRDSGRHHAAIDPAWHQVPDELTALARIRAKLADAAAALFVAEAAGEIVGLLELRLVAPAPAGIIRPRSCAQVGVAVREGAAGTQDRRGPHGQLGWRNFATEFGAGAGAGRNLSLMGSWSFEIPVFQGPGW